MASTSIRIKLNVPLVGFRVMLKFSISLGRNNLIIPKFKWYISKLDLSKAIETGKYSSELSNSKKAMFLGENKSNFTSWLFWYVFWKTK